jgi:mono/diheme cytochrome c family protein
MLAEKTEIERREAMKRFGFSLSALATVFLLTAFYSGPVAEAQGAKVPDGKQIFLAQKCETCHSVSTAGIAATTKSEKMKGPDLVNIKEDAKTLTAYLKKTADLNCKKHAKEVKLSDADLKTLIDWILAQKK